MVGVGVGLGGAPCPFSSPLSDLLECALVVQAVVCLTPLLYQRKYAKGSCLQASSVSLCFVEGSLFFPSPEKPRVCGQRSRCSAIFVAVSFVANETLLAVARAMLFAINSSHGSIHVE